MAGESKARLLAEVAALSETVRELRDEVAQLRSARPACGCVHICTGTHPAWQWYPGVTYCGGAAGENTAPYNVSITDSSLKYTTTNAAAGVPGWNTQTQNVVL